MFITHGILSSLLSFYRFPLIHQWFNQALIITIDILSSHISFYRFPLIHQWFIQSLIITIDILSSHISFYRFLSIHQRFWFRLNFLNVCIFDLFCFCFISQLWIGIFWDAFGSWICQWVYDSWGKEVVLHHSLGQNVFYQYGFGDLPLNCMCLHRRCTTLSSAL